MTSSIVKLYIYQLIQSVIIIVFALYGIFTSGGHNPGWMIFWLALGYISSVVFLVISATTYLMGWVFNEWK